MPLHDLCDAVLPHGPSQLVAALPLLASTLRRRSGDARSHALRFQG